MLNENRIFYFLGFEKDHLSEIILKTLNNNLKLKIIVHESLSAWVWYSSCYQNC